MNEQSNNMAAAANMASPEIAGATAQPELMNRLTISTTLREVESQIDVIHGMLIKERMANETLKKQVTEGLKKQEAMQVELDLLKGSKKGVKKA